jgi:hypothetical protein
MYNEGRKYLSRAADLWQQHPERLDVILFADTLARLAEQTDEDAAIEGDSEQAA